MAHELLIVCFRKQCSSQEMPPWSVVRRFSASVCTVCGWRCGDVVELGDVVEHCRTQTVSCIITNE